MEEIGLFDTPILFFENIKTTGSQGEVINSYELVCELYGKVEVGSSEGNDNYNFSESDTLTVTTYKLPKLTTMWRAKIGCKWYEINSITSNDRISPINTLTLTSINGEG